MVSLLLFHRVRKFIQGILYVTGVNQVAHMLLLGFVFQGRQKFLLLGGSFLQQLQFQASAYLILGKKRICRLYKLCVVISLKIGFQRRPILVFV